MPILIPDSSPCTAATAGQADQILPADPFTALQFHFGMLLGVDDLETLAANPRGKTWLHNAWLHREGVVWGFGVTVDTTAGEVRVAPGLALDAMGRELHLDAAACVNLGAWFEAHKGDFDPPIVAAPDGSVTFDAHVVVRYRACLSRQVPAITDPCGANAADTAYSRALETAELLLEPLASTPKPLPYHRLRLLFDLDAPNVVNGTTDPGDAAIVVRREDIRNNHPPADQPGLYLAAFREYAALDTIDLAPASASDGTTTIFPEDSTTEVLLADVLGVKLLPAPGASPPWTLAAAPAPGVVTKVRPSHVATATIQELLNGPLFGPGGGGQADAGGPRVIPSTVQLAADKRSVTFRLTGPLAPMSVATAAVTVACFDDAVGWSNLDILSAQVSGAGADTVTVALKETAAGSIARLLVRGRGPEPVLGVVGTGRIPLAGVVGGPPGTKDDGHDFAIMIAVGS
jgi:hypothetical protein